MCNSLIYNIYIYIFTCATHSYTTYNNFKGVLKEIKGGKEKKKRKKQ